MPLGTNHPAVAGEETTSASDGQINNLYLSIITVRRREALSMIQKNKKAVATACLFVAMSSLGSVAVAQESRISFGPTLGTTGIGLELGVALTETISARASYNFFEYDTDYDDTDVVYDANLDKSSVSLLLDWNLGNGGFRLTGGAFLHSENSVQVDAMAASDGTYTFNGNEYSARDAGRVNGAISFRKTTPYLGIGWGNLTRDKGFTMAFDLGVQLQDSPKVSLTSHDCGLGTLICGQLSSDLRAEARELQEDGEDFELWPVVAFSLVYRF